MHVLHIFLHVFAEGGEGDREESARARLVHDANAFLRRVFSPRFCQGHYLRYPGAAWAPVYARLVRQASMHARTLSYAEVTKLSIYGRLPHQTDKKIGSGKELE